MIASTSQLPQPSSRAQLDPLMFAGMFALLAVALPYLSLYPIQDIDWNVEMMLSIGIALYTAIRLSWMAAVGRPRLLQMTFFIFIYVWIGIAGNAQNAVGLFPWRAAHSPADVLPALLQVYLTIAAFEIGCMSIHWRPKNAAAPKIFERLSFTISDRATAWLSVFALAACSYGIFLFHGQVFTTRAQASSLDISSALSVSLISERMLRVPSLIAFVVVCYNAKLRWKTLTRARREFYFAMVGVLAVLLFVTNYPPALPRHWLGAVILTPAFALIRWRRWLAGFWIATLTAGLIVAFPYLDLFRYASSWSEAIDQLEVADTVLNPLLTKPDYDVWQSTLNGYAYTETHGVLMGSNLEGAALFWVPRSIWPGKPIGSSAIIATSAHYTFTNLTAPLWAEFNMAFGWFGVGLLMLLYGRLVGWGEKLYEQSLETDGYGHLSRVLVPYWAGFHIYMLRGDLLNAVAFSSFGFLLLLGTTVLPKIATPSSKMLEPMIALRSGHRRP